MKYVPKVQKASVAIHVQLVSVSLKVVSSFLIVSTLL